MMGRLPFSKLYVAILSYRLASDSVGVYLLLVFSVSKCQYL